MAQAKCDARALSDTELDAPHPLPHVSRRALRRITGWIAPPTRGPYCNEQPALVSNSAIYGREYGDWPYAYHCAPCDAYVGLHPNTDLPLGTMADRHLREARKQKSIFLRLSKARGWTRKQAYRWLADQMEIDADACHWGWFDQEQCGLAAAICLRELETA